MPRKKVTRAPAGAWDVINRVNEIVQYTNASEVARLLGVSRRSIYNFRNVATSNRPARDVIAKATTLKSWNDRLQSAATKTITRQIEAVEKGKPTPRRAKEAAKIISAGTGEKWSYQKVSSYQRKFAVEKPEPSQTEYTPPDYYDDIEPIRWSEPTLTLKDVSERTRADYDAGLTRHFVEDGIRYMAAGEEWLNDDGSRRQNVEERKTWTSKEGLKDYITEVGYNNNLLVVEILIDADGDEYYQVYLDYED